MYPCSDDQSPNLFVLNGNVVSDDGRHGNMCLSCPRMLRHCTKRYLKALFIDHTYRLMLNGWFLLVLATHDATGRLLPIAFQITTGEAEPNITELLSSVENWVYILFTERFLVSVLHSVADMSLSIANSLTAKARAAIQHMCYFHLKQLLESNVRLSLF